MRRERFFRLAVPNVLANLTVPLAGLVDTAVLGHLARPEPLAGVALGSVIFDLLWGVFGVLRMATTGQVAQAHGAGDHATGAASVWRGVALGGVAGLILWVLAPWVTQLAFGVMVAPGAVESEGAAYAQARFWGAPAALVGFVVLGALLGQGRGRAVLAMAAVANLTNVALDLWWVRGLGWGAAGAGYASAVSQWAGLLVGGALLGRWAWAHRPSRAVFLNRQAWRDTVSLQRDIMVRTLTLTGVFASVAQVGASFGVVGLAAQTLLLKILAAGAWVIDGLAFATEALVGEAYGAGRRDEVKGWVRYALPWGAGFGASLGLWVWGAPGLSVGLLTSQPDVLHEATRWSGALVPLLGLGGLAYIWDGAFIGMSDGPSLRWAMLWSAALGYVPFAVASWWLGNPLWLWVGLCTFMGARSITLWSRRPWRPLAPVGPPQA